MSALRVSASCFASAARITARRRGRRRGRRGLRASAMVDRNHAGTAAVWRPAGHQHPQRREPALARIAKNRCLVPATPFCEYDDTKAARDNDMVRPVGGQPVVQRVDTRLVGTEANAVPGYASSTQRHNCALASIVVINSNASSISGKSGVGANPSKAGASTARPLAGRAVAR
jgi:hypothetical protein